MRTLSSLFRAPEGKPTSFQQCEKVQIDFLSIQVPDIRAMVEFYSSGLGFPLLTVRQDCALFRVGSTVLMFEQVEDPDPDGPPPYYHFAFDIPRNRLDQAEAWLSERVDLLKRDGERQIPFEDWNARAVYFHDPAGNIVEFIARHNLPNESEETFSSHSILRVSEIGWPCLLGILDRDFGLPVWWETKGFTAFGSETGLILVVDTQRKWLPTDKAAQAHPVTIVLSDENGSREFYRR